MREYNKNVHTGYLCLMELRRIFNPFITSFCISSIFSKEYACQKAKTTREKKKKKKQQELSLRKEIYQAVMCKLHTDVRRGALYMQSWYHELSGPQKHYSLS